MSDGPYMANTYGGYAFLVGLRRAECPYGEGSEEALHWNEGYTEKETDARLRAARKSPHLLPCPFCGGEKLRDDWIRDGRMLSCVLCGVSMRMYNGHGGPEATSRSLAEKWNSRSSALLDAGNLLAEEVRYVLEEASDDARTKALRAWSEAIAKVTGAA